MPTKPPVAPPVEDLTEDGFRIRRATMRGVTYVLQELPADEYEKMLKSSTSEDGRTIDNGTLLRLMLGKCLIEPKIAVAEIMKRPYPVVRKLNDIVDDLHYTPEESVEERDAAAEEKTKDEGKV